MSWILTAQGHAFDVLNPMQAQIEIRDIARALSRQCRFTGHTRRFYSVAEHSYRVSLLVKPEHALCALLHDASEAYLTDLATPIKQILPGYKMIEERLQRVIAKRFELPYPFPTDVKAADLIMLATEKRDLMPIHPAPWPQLEGIEPDQTECNCWLPAVAEAKFLTRFYDLTRVLN